MIRMTEIGHGHGRAALLALLALVAGSVCLTWAWKVVAVKLFALPAAGFMPALAVLLAIGAAGWAFGAGARLAAKL